MTQRPDISDLGLSKVSMSNKQYAALKMFLSTDNAMQVDDALQVDQRSFGSLFHRDYIKYDARQAGFTVTALGRQAMHIFDTTTVIKETQGYYFSSYIRSVRALSDYQRRNGK